METNYIVIADIEPDSRIETFDHDGRRNWHADLKTAFVSAPQFDYEMADAIASKFGGSIQRVGDYDLGERD